jgi:hypothetical protein
VASGSRATLARTTYAEVNRAHLADLLAEREDIVVPERTLRRILDEAGVPKARGRRRARHRSRRERMVREGLLLQVDGSRHDWLEGRGPMLTLVGGIDDATSRVTGVTFRLQEEDRITGRRHCQVMHGPSLASDHSSCGPNPSDAHRPGSS